MSDDWIEGAEKTELHVHLEGSLETATLRELDPKLVEAAIEEHLDYEDFAGFLEAFKWAVGYLRSPDDFALATRRLLGRLAEQNVRYVEVTLSAGVALWRRQDFAAIYEAVKAEAARSAVEVWWVLDAVRQFGPEHVGAVARLAAERAGDGVVAFGIGGDEVAAEAGQFREAFELARSHGLRLAPHAGEMAGAESVWQCLRMGADRIGHGIRAVDDPALVAYLRDRDIPLEICLTSNVRTGAVASWEQHPVRRLFDAGVPLVLNTDDPGLFRTTLVEEYRLAARRFGFSREELRKLMENGFRYRFRGGERFGGASERGR